MIKPVTLAATEYICLNMRERDRAEIFGMRSHDNALWLAAEVVRMAAEGRAVIAQHRGVPAGIAGANRLWPGCYTIWAFGTDRWPCVAVDLIRWARTDLKSWLLAGGAHRVQCESRSDHVDAHRLLERFGAERECVLRSYGRDGADYFLYAWVKHDVHRQTENPAAQGRSVPA